MSTKYNAASSAMVPRTLGILAFITLDLAATNKINENARVSGAHISPGGRSE